MKEEKMERTARLRKSLTLEEILLEVTSTDWPGASTSAPVGIGAIREVEFWIRYARNKGSDEFSPRQLKELDKIHRKVDKLLERVCVPKGYLATSPLW